MVVLRYWKVALIVVGGAGCEIGEFRSSLQVSVRVGVKSAGVDRDSREPRRTHADGLSAFALDSIIFKVKSSVRTCERARLGLALGGEQQASEARLYAIFERFPGEGLVATASVSALALFGTTSLKEDVMVRLFCRDRLAAESNKIAVRYKFKTDDLAPAIFGFDRVEVNDNGPTYVFDPGTEVGVVVQIPPEVRAHVVVQSNEQQLVGAKIRTEGQSTRRWSIALPSPLPPGTHLKLLLSGQEIVRWIIRAAPAWQRPSSAFQRKLGEARSTEHGRQILRLALEGRGWRRQAALLALSRFARSFGAADEVRDLFEEMLRNARDLRSPSEEAAAHRRLAFLAGLEADYDDAHVHLERSAQITQRWRDLAGQARTSRAHGVLLLRTQAPGAVALASKSFRSCRRLALRSADEALSSMCAAYEAAGLAQHESVSRARQLLSGVPPSQQQSDIWKTMRVFVEYHAFELGSLDRGETEALAVMANQALASLTASAESSLIRFLLSAQVRVMLEQGDLDNARRTLSALERLRSHHAVLDSIPAPLLRADVAIASGKLAAAETFLQPILESAHTLTEDRLQALLLLAEAQGQAGNLVDADASLNRLDRELAELFRRFESPPARARLLRRLRGALEFRQKVRLESGQPIRALGVGEQLRLLMLSSYVSHSHWTVSSRLPELRILPERLPADAGILVVEPYHEGVLTYFSRGRGAWRHAVVPSVQDAIPLLGTGLRRLYLTGNALTDRGFANLRGVDGRALALGLEVVRLASLLPIVPARQQEWPTNSLVIADPDGTLLHGGEEGEIVTRLINARLLIGPDATRRRALTVLKAGVDVFHFAGHAEHSLGAPLSVRLRLFDGVLRLNDWLLLPVAPRVAVLNTCSSGPDAGPFALRLAEVLLARGSRYVVTTTHRIEDQDSREFMALFFKFDGQREPARALRRASNVAATQGIDTWRAVQLWAHAPQF